MLHVDILPVLTDNYIFMLVDQGTQTCVVVDPAEAKPVLEYLQENNLTLSAIYNTHHHFDHVGGNRELKEVTGCDVYGYGPDKERLPGIDHSLKEGDMIHIGGSQARVLFAPGHTRGHILYYFEKDRKCFVGDTLFSMGCGRLFEGTPAQMWHSLEQFFHLPDETEIYCAHEYTLANIRFAETLLGGDADLLSYKEMCLEKQARGEPTVPTILGLEKRLNPFLAVASSDYRAALGFSALSPAESFAKIRAQKDDF